MRYVLFAFTAPWSVIMGWGWIALLWLCRIVRDLRWEDTLVLTGVFRDWVVIPRMLPWSPKIGGVRQPTPLWRFSTTIGRGIAYQPGARASLGWPLTRIQKHEYVHVRQVEDHMMWSFITGLIALFWVGPLTGDWGVAFGLFFLLWFLGGASQTVNWITAAMRGLDAYRDSEHERSAYAQTDPGPDGKSWLDLREETTK
jgi:hypothetical protein